MSRNGYVILTAIVLGLSTLFVGCNTAPVKDPSDETVPAVADKTPAVTDKTPTAPEVTLSLKLAAGQTDVFKVTSEAIKDYSFIQPNAGKSVEEQSKTRVEMEFTQQIEKVDAAGTATAKITINNLKVDVVTKNNLTFDFDSKDAKSKTAPMSKLIGQSYTITLTDAGEAKLLDAGAAVASVTGPATEKALVGNILSANSITARHQMRGLPKKEESSVSADKTWSTVVPSPPGLLTPKSFEKVYTLKKVDNNVASVEMTATESDKPAANGEPAAGGMGIFAKMFDNTDNYTGTMQMDVANGKVMTCQETLVSTYVAMEMPKGGDAEKGPDVLTMRFTDRFDLEKLK